MLLLISTIFSMMIQLDFLENLEWQNRIILLFEPNVSTDSNVNDQLEKLKEDNDGLIDRDLKIFIIEEDRVTNDRGRLVFNADAEEVRDKFKVNNAAFTFILLGKDGGVKLKETNLVSNDKLFTIIDNMPMRRREMKNDGGN